MLVPPNHPKSDHFSIETYGDLGIPILGNLHIVLSTVKWITLTSRKLLNNGKSWVNHDL